MLGLAQLAVEPVTAIWWAGAIALVAAVGGALELDGRVADAIGGAQHRRDAVQDWAAVARRHVVYHGMAGERQHSTGDGPDVEVVHVMHARHTQHIAHERRQRETAWGGFEQDTARLADQPDGAGDDQRRDQQADQWIDPGRAGERDYERGEDDAGRRGNVAEDMQRGGAHIEVAVTLAIESDANVEVDGDREAGGGDHDGRLDRLRVGEALQRFVDDTAGDRDERQAVDQRR